MSAEESSQADANATLAKKKPARARKKATPKVKEEPSMSETSEEEVQVEGQASVKKVAKPRRRKFDNELTVRLLAAARAALAAPETGQCMLTTNDCPLTMFAGQAWQHPLKTLVYFATKARCQPGSYLLTQGHCSCCCHLHACPTRYVKYALHLSCSALHGLSASMDLQFVSSMCCTCLCFAKVFLWPPS